MFLVEQRMCRKEKIIRPEKLESIKTMAHLQKVELKKELKTKNDLLKVLRIHLMSKAIFKPELQ